MKKKFFIEAFKYGIVGILNTLLTAFSIWIMMLLLGYSKEENVPAFVISISNITGYVIGLINSFIWNRNWTFKSQAAWKKEFGKFILAFIICYIPQLLLVNVLNNYSDISAYFCQLTGIVFFTVTNFLCNKYYIFKK
jgi:putative flippase GtrA